MRRVEIPQRPGGFDFELVAPPRALVDALVDAYHERDGYIVLFDTRVATPSLETARYSGVIMDRIATNRFGGTGPAGLLATDLGVGIKTATDIEYSARSLTSWAAIIAGNDITVGDIDDTSNVGATYAVGMSALDLLNQVTSAAGARWRINPDFSLDIGTAADLYGAAPKVIVTEQATSALGDGDLRGITGKVSRLRGTGKNLTDRAIGAGLTADYDTGRDATVAGRGPAGADLELTRTIDLAGVEGADVENLTEASLARFKQIDHKFDVSTSSPGVERFVEPGALAYVAAEVHGCSCGVELVAYGGRNYFPITVEIHELEVDSYEGQGVWLLRHDGTDEDWLDLSPFVQFGDGSSRWKIATGGGPVDAVVTDGPVRR